MFTPKQRERVRDSIVEVARSDPRIMAAASVGSTAEGADRWSDLDLTFGLVAGARVQDVLEDWTRMVASRLRGIPLFDIESGPSMYRVFLLPGNLQVDLSFTPGAEFGARGPRFDLIFGEESRRVIPQGPSPRQLFGQAVHHLVRARICVERGRLWQAEYWVSSARDIALTLACLERGLEHSHGRGFDQLPQEVRRQFSNTLVRTVERNGLLSAISGMVDLLLADSRGAEEVVTRLKDQLQGLKRESL